MRRLRRGLVALGLLLLGLLVLLAIRERYDPYLVLYLDDIVHPKAAPIVIPLNDELTLRAYSDTRPHTGKVASLQKALVLAYKGRELIEEGFGFGLPIVVADDVAHLSRDATVSIQHLEDRVKLIKTYSMNTADRPTRFLRVKYEDVQPLGTVVFTYTVTSPNTIDVQVDFTGLEVTWDRAYLMNEQGAINFPTYVDEEGGKWSGDDIGRWRSTFDTSGCWLSKSEELRFCVETEPGRKKFVGRERYNQYRWTGVFYLSWSGIDIEIEPPIPRYQYTIRVEQVP